MESNLHFVEYGNPNGTPVVYFHGAPGGPEECCLFDAHAKIYNLNVMSFDRFAIDSSLTAARYYQFIADTIRQKTNGRPIDFIGFSIGCHSAIETSAYINENVRNLYLISAAAPLDAGAFIDNMAGKFLFSAAIKSPVVFNLISYWQNLMAKLAPNMLYKILFASATGQDKELSKTIDFKEHVTPILADCFKRNLTGYMRDIKQYVTPWQSAVRDCKANVHLWHGDQDNWSPISMALHLANNMPNCSSPKIIKGASHFTCLASAAPEICAQINKN